MTQAINSSTKLPTSLKKSGIYDRLKNLPGRLLLYTPLILWGLITVFPFLWVGITSFREQTELYSRPFAWPAVWHFENYLNAWREAHVGLYARNSFMVTVLSTALAVLVSAMPAYIFSRINFRWKGVLWAYVLMGLMVPGVTTLLTLGVIVRKVGFYDSLFGLAAVYAFAGVPFNVFLLRSFMQTIPRELEEAAVMDGAGMGAVFWHVILPMSVPALTTVATFHALYVWGEYILSVICLISPEKFLLPMGIKNILGEFNKDYPGYAAAMVMSMIPSLIFFLVFQRYVVKGISAGALKDI
jgi:raffinose/stachyose/melibiose transport system permease protein